MRFPDSNPVLEIESENRTFAPLRWPSGCANPLGHRSHHTNNILAFNETPDKDTLVTFPTAFSGKWGKESGCCKSNGKRVTTRETDAARSKTKQKFACCTRDRSAAPSSVFLCIGKQSSRPSDRLALQMPKRKERLKRSVRRQLEITAEITGARYIVMIS